MRNGVQQRFRSNLGYSETGADLWSFIVRFIFISHGGSHFMQLFKVKKTP